MLNILNYCSTYLPHIGGIEQNIYYFSKYSKMNHNVLTDQLENTQLIEKIDSVTVYRTPPINKINIKSKKDLILKLIFEFSRDRNKKRFLEELNYDILHLRAPYLSNDFWYGLDCLFGSSFFKLKNPWEKIDKPKISTFHLLLSKTKFIDPISESHFWIYREKNSWEKFEKYICQQSKEIICVDKYMVKHLEHLTNGRTIHFIPSGVDQTIFKPMKKEESITYLPENFRTPFNNNFIVLFLGRLDPMKGISFLEKLANFLPESIKIIQVGSGKLENKTSKILKFEKLDNKYIPYLINSSDVVFQPLILEGISRVSLEALSCGKPLIMLGSNLDRYPIENEKNGYVVDTPKQAADIILKLFNSTTLLKQISSNAISTSFDFDVQKLSKKLDKIYELCID